MQSLHSWIAFIGLWQCMGATMPAADPVTAGGFTGPASLLAECGEMAVRWDGEKLWTPSRIDYRGTRLGIEDSAYGTVFNLDGVGFIGSAHRDIETETIHAVQFFLDGQRLDGNQTHVHGKTFRCERRSQVRELELDSVIEIEGSQLRETARIQARSAVKFEVIYHFMHAWTPEVTHYYYGRDRKILSGGTFSDLKVDDRVFYFEKEPDWVAVFDAKSGKAAVSRVLEKPKTGGVAMQLWNVQGVYRKFYLMSFMNEVMPKGFDGIYRMTTEFFTTTPETLQDDLLRIAEKLEAGK